MERCWGERNTFEGEGALHGARGEMDELDNGGDRQGYDAIRCDTIRYDTHESYHAPAPCIAYHHTTTRG